MERCNFSIVFRGIDVGFAVTEVRWCAFDDAMMMNVEDGLDGRTSGLNEDEEFVDRIRQQDELSDDEVGWPR